MALKKVQIVKITPGQIPTYPIENYLTAKFPIPLLPPALNAIIKPCQMSYDHPLSQKKTKKQGNKKSSEGGDWQGGWAKFEKEAGGGRGGGVGNIGDLDKIVG